MQVFLQSDASTRPPSALILAPVPEIGLPRRALPVGGGDSTATRSWWGDRGHSGRRRATARLKGSGASMCGRNPTVTVVGAARERVGAAGGDS